MVDPHLLLFIHGSDSNSQTYKASLLRQRYPDIVVPDFTGGLKERMEQLEGVIGKTANWTIIGSSLGGTMATLFAARHPNQVRKLVLLAPALVLVGYTQGANLPIQIPCTIIHGRQDEVVPLEETRKLAEKFFSRPEFIMVDDDHRLHKTAETLDWHKILA